MEDFFKKFTNPKLLIWKPKKLKFSIRYKLLSIVSLVIILSLGTIIILVTIFYKKNTETLIQEYNLSLARLTGDQLESNLNQLVNQSQSLIESRNESSKWKEREEKFLKKYQNVLFLGYLVLDKEKNYIYSYDLKNQIFFNENKIDERLTQDWKSFFINEINKNYSETLLVLNHSTKFNFPVLTLFIPSELNSKEVMILSIQPTELIQSLQKALQTDLFQVLVVNFKGSLLVHSNPKETLSAGNLTDHPIVKKILTTSVDNGSQKFEINEIEYLGSFKKMEFGGLSVVSTVESDLVFEAIYQIQKRNIIITIIVLTISFIIIYLFANTLTLPLTDLVLATDKIEKGNFKVEIIPSTRDEIGLLTESFIKMAKGLQERENIKNTFGKFVNKEIAEKALHGELKLGGNNKNCAVFFSDLRSFTTMSENLSAEQVVLYLNQYFTEMVECIYRNSGIVDKFIGDAIMAHWGAVYTEGKDTEQAIDAAIEMRKALIDFNQNKSEKRPFFKFGCGINTGEVIAGQIGSEKKLEYTVIGDTVNLASRIEYLNKEFKTDILISENSYAIVKDLYDTVQMPEVQIRGKAKPQRIYAILGKKGDPTNPKNLDDLRYIIGTEI
jgi:adenylate cyclase